MLLYYALACAPFFLLPPGISSDCVSGGGSGRLFAALILGTVCIGVDGQFSVLMGNGIHRESGLCSEPVCHG